MRRFSASTRGQQTKMEVQFKDVQDTGNMLASNTNILAKKCSILLLTIWKTKEVRQLLDEDISPVISPLYFTQCIYRTRQWNSALLQCICHVDGSAVASQLRLHMGPSQFIQHSAPLVWTGSTNLNSEIILAAWSCGHTITMVQQKTN